MDCSVFDELELGEFSATLLAGLTGKRYPLSGMFELTERCNLSCVHCYVNQPASSKVARASELTTEEVKRILDQIADAGCLFLTLTGGEPLLRPDFLELYLHARKRGIIASIFTNGTLLTPEITDALVKVKPLFIEISLYGSTQETYEKVTRVPGSFARCMRGIHLMKERGLPLYLKSALITENRHELMEMQSLAQELGVSFRYDGQLWPRLDGDTTPLNYRFSAEELVAIDCEDPERLAEIDRVAREMSGKDVRGENVYVCGGGLFSFYITAKGLLKSCGMVRYPIFDLKELSFAEAWEQMGVIRTLKRQKDSPCITCAMGALCQQCPAWSQAVHGDDETIVEDLCEIAHLRYAQVNANIIV